MVLYLVHLHFYKHELHTSVHIARACLTGMSLRATARCGAFTWARAHGNEQTIPTIRCIYIVQSCNIDAQCSKVHCMRCLWKASKAWEWGPADRVLVRTDWSKSSAKQARLWGFQHCPWLYGTSALFQCFQINFSLKRWTWSEVWWGTNAINIVLPFDHTCCDQKWESEAAKRWAGAWSNYHWCMMGAGWLQTRSRALRAWFRLWTCAGNSRNAE